MFFKRHNKLFLCILPPRLSIQAVSLYQPWNKWATHWLIYLVRSTLVYLLRRNNYNCLADTVFLWRQKWKRFFTAKPREGTDPPRAAGKIWFTHGKYIIDPVSHRKIIVDTASDIGLACATVFLWLFHWQPQIYDIDGISVYQRYGQESKNISSPVKGRDQLAGVRCSETENDMYAM